MAPRGYPKSAKQIEFVDALRKRLRITTELFDRICHDLTGVSYDAMDMNACSRLIAQLDEWRELPASYLIAQGQTVIPGFDVG